MVQNPANLNPTVDPTYMAEAARAERPRSELSGKLVEIAEDLAEEEKPLESKLAEVEAQRQTIHSELTKIQTLLKTIQGKPVNEKRRERTGVKRSGFTKIEIAELVDEITKKEGKLSEKDLKARLL